MTSQASQERVAPGRSALVLGPSGSGKSHLLLTAAQHYGSGVFVLAQGNDELESYRALYKDADFLITAEDQQRLVKNIGDEKKPVWSLESSKPYLIATFDDPDFLPSVGDWKATGLSSMLGFLKLVRAKVAAEAAEGRPSPWTMLGLDTFSGIGVLANNAMCSSLRVEVPPKARGEGGAQYYIGYKNKLNEVSRLCRAMRGYGMHWLAASHVTVKETSDSYGAEDVMAREQVLANFTGSFREDVPAFFDLVFYTGVDKGHHYALYQPDAFKQSKSRYQMDTSVLDKKGRLENDWPKIEAAIR